MDKVRPQFFGFEQSIFLCLTYITPEKSCHQSSRDHLWNIIRQEIAGFYS